MAYIDSSDAPHPIYPAGAGLPLAISPETKLPNPFHVYKLPSGRFMYAVNVWDGKYISRVRRAFATYAEAITYAILGDD